MKDPDHGDAVRKHPALQVWRDNSLAFRSYAAVFGLSPADRARVQGQPMEEEDEWAMYMRRKGGGEENEEEA